MPVNKGTIISPFIQEVICTQNNQIVGQKKLFGGERFGQQMRKYA